MGTKGHYKYYKSSTVRALVIDYKSFRGIKRAGSELGSRIFTTSLIPSLIDPIVWIVWRFFQVQVFVTLKELFLTSGQNCFTTWDSTFVTVWKSSKINSILKFNQNLENHWTLIKWNFCILNYFHHFLWRFIENVPRWHFYSETNSIRFRLERRSISIGHFQAPFT